MKRECKSSADERGSRVVVCYFASRLPAGGIRRVVPRAAVSMPTVSARPESPTRAVWYLCVEKLTMAIGSSAMS